MPKRSSRVQPVVGIELYIEFTHIKPSIWRTVLVHSRMSLEELHAIIQELFIWNDAHFYRFTHASRAYMRPNPDLPARDAFATKLAALQLGVGDILAYEYDFGDGWEIQLRVASIEPYEPNLQYPQCLAGARAGPPEDSGGPALYPDLLASLADPSHPEHADRRAWVGPHFHPDAIDLRTTNRILELLFVSDSAI